AGGQRSLQRTSRNVAVILGKPCSAMITPSPTVAIRPPAPRDFRGGSSYGAPENLCCGAEATCVAGTEVCSVIDRREGARSQLFRTFDWLPLLDYVRTNQAR